MRVKCLLNTIDDELAKREGIENWPDYYHSITVGKEYVVLGLSYDPALTTFYGGKPVIELKDDGGILTAIPIFLFEITDSTPSKYWKIQYGENGALTMYPESFYREFYHDDLSEGVSDIEDDFAKVCMNFENE